MDTLVIFDWFVLSMRMQVILDSPFAQPGSAPIGGGKKGEFRDWTSRSFVRSFFLSFGRWFVRSLVDSFAHSFVCSFVRSFAASNVFLLLNLILKLIFLN